MKEKINVTKEDLEDLGEFLKDKEIEVEFKFKDTKLLYKSMYLSTGASNYISWDTKDLTLQEIKVLVTMLNCNLKSHKLVYIK